MIYHKRNAPLARPKTFNKPTLAVPDQTLSLKTMVQKYVRGLPISAPQLNGIYTDDDMATDFSRLDLAEQEEAILNASDELKNLKGVIAQEQQKKAAEAKEKAEKLQSEVEDLRRQLADKTS